LSTFDCHSYLGGSVVPGVAVNAASIAAGMAARGIDAAVLLSARACLVDPLAGNRILKAMLEQAPNLYACLVAHTNRVAASTTVMRELMGSRKFVCMALVGANPDEPVHKVAADEILNAYRRYGKPLFLYARNAEAVAAAEEIARGYPMLRVVMIGMGGTHWPAAISAAHACTNILLETSGPLDRAKLPAAVETLGSHRVLFGSGAPHVDAAAATALVADSPLGDEARGRILWHNARRVFGLDDQEAE
jgi:uncharacterized protein